MSGRSESVTRVRTIRDCKLCIGSVLYLLGVRDTVLTKHNLRMARLNACHPCASLLSTTFSMPREMYPPIRTLMSMDSQACQLHAHRERYYMAKRHLLDQVDPWRFCNECQRTIQLARTNMVAEQLIRDLDMDLDD